MRRIAYLTITLIMMLLSGCNSPKGCYDFYGSWCVDNKSVNRFEVVVTVLGIYNAEDGFVSSVGPISRAIITPHGAGWAWYAGYSTTAESSRKATITFNFNNGVSHVFEGEMIGCDVRNADNWTVSYRGEENHLAEHVYTFTQEDYDEIMALYE